MESDDLTHTAGMTDLGAGRTWILARELMPDWLEHIFRLTSPPPAKAEEATAAVRPMVAEAAGLAEGRAGMGGM